MKFMLRSSTFIYIATVLLKIITVVNISEYFNFVNFANSAAVIIL